MTYICSRNEENGKHKLLVARLQYSSVSLEPVVFKIYGTLAYSVPFFLL